jgi:hypothetical protein
METLIEDHVKHVQLLCRICAQRVKLAETKLEAKLCVNYQGDILRVHGIDVSSDNSVYFPGSFCDKCYRRIVNFNHRKTFSYKSADFT